MTDLEIVSLFFERDESAISECDLKYGRALFSLGKRITADDGYTEECKNDTYLRTWQTVPPTDPRTYLFAYLAKIMRGFAVDRVRREERKKRAASITAISDEICEAIPSPDSADGEAISAELRDILEKFLLMLKTEARHIFVLRYFYFEELRSIAKRLSLTEGMIKSSLKRSRDKLKKYLTEYGYEGG